MTGWLNTTQKSTGEMEPSSLQDAQAIAQGHTRTYDLILGKSKKWKQRIIRNRIMEKLERNQTRQTQRSYQNTFGHSHICLTRRNSKSYQRDMNRTTR